MFAGAEELKLDSRGMPSFAPTQLPEINSAQQEAASPDIKININLNKPEPPQKSSLLTNSMLGMGLTLGDGDGDEDEASEEVLFGESQK